MEFSDYITSFKDGWTGNEVNIEWLFLLFQKEHLIPIQVNNEYLKVFQEFM